MTCSVGEREYLFRVNHAEQKYRSHKDDHPDSPNLSHALFETKRAYAIFQPPYGQQSKTLSLME